MSLFNEVNRQWKLFVNSFYVSKSVSFLEKENFTKAYELISKIDNSSLKKGFYQYYLYKGFIAFKLKKYNEALNLFHATIKEIHIAYTNKKITNEDLHYLVYYSYSYVLFISYLEEDYDECNSIAIKIKELNYNIKKVNQSIVEAFPLNKKIDILLYETF